jgi:hypothetical protein
MANRIYPAALPNPVTPLGYDGSDFRAIEVNTNAHLVVDIDSIPTTLVQTVSGDKFYGFHAIVEETLSNLTLAAGYNALSGAAVAAGDIWRVMHCALLYSGTVPTSVRIRVVGLATALMVFMQLAPVSGFWYVLASDIYLQVGDYMQAEVYGATLNDDLYFSYAGLKLYAP